VARAGSQKHRDRKAGARSDDYWIERQNALVGELHALDRALGVRNVILQRLGDHLTEEEKHALAGG